MDILKDLHENTQACKVRTSSNDKMYKLVNKNFRKAATLDVLYTRILFVRVRLLRLELSRIRKLDIPNFCTKGTPNKVLPKKLFLEINK